MLVCSQRKGIESSSQCHFVMGVVRVTVSGRNGQREGKKQQRNNKATCILSKLSAACGARKAVQTGDMVASSRSNVGGQ